MFDFRKITGLAAAAMLASVVGVQASPWTVDGGSLWTLPGAAQTSVVVLTFNPKDANDIPGDIVAGTTKVTVGGTLKLAEGIWDLTFGYLGKEAGAQNAALAVPPGAVLFDNHSGGGESKIVKGPYGPVEVGEGGEKLPFSLTTTFGVNTTYTGGGSVANGSAGVNQNPNVPKPQIAFFLPTPDSARVYWFLDDGGHGTSGAIWQNGVKCKSGDCDFDDMYGYIEAVRRPVVNPEITPVPLPAAGFLLLGGLGGLGVVRRWRRA